MANPECCKTGIGTIRDEVIGNKTVAWIMKGMVKHGLKAVTERRDMSIRELADHLVGSPVTFEDAFGFQGEDMVFYRPDRDKDARLSTSSITGTRLAVAVATCVARCVDETCVTLEPFSEKLVEVTRRN